MNKTIIKYLYISGLLLLFGSLLFFAFEWVEATTSRFLISIAFVVLAAAFSIELIQTLYRLILKIVNHPVRKWVFIVIGGFVLTITGIVAKIESNKLIHSFTKVDPSDFPYTTALLFFGTSLFIWLMIVVVSLIVGAFVYVIYLNASPLIEMFGGMKTAGMVLAFGRIFGTVSTAMFLALGGVLVGNASRLLPNLLVYADYLPSSDCSNHKPDEYAVKLKDGNISVAIPMSNGSYTFQTRRCELLP